MKHASSRCRTPCKPPPRSPDSSLLETPSLALAAGVGAREPWPALLTETDP